MTLLQVLRLMVLFRVKFPPRGYRDWATLSDEPLIPNAVDLQKMKLLFFEPIFGSTRFSGHPSAENRDIPPTIPRVDNRADM
jgi:hypothetical protein